MEDVELERLSSQVLSIQGPRAAGHATAIGQPQWAVDRLGYGGVDLLVDPLRSTPRWRPFGAQWSVRAAWELARLRSARPRLGPDFRREQPSLRRQA